MTLMKYHRLEWQCGTDASSFHGTIAPITFPLQGDVRSPALYKSSTLVQLAHSGKYIGPTNIVEYFLFVSEASPFVSNLPVSVYVLSFIKFGTDESAVSAGKDVMEYCQFYVAYVARITLNDEYSNLSHLEYETVTFLKIFWDPNEEIVAKVHGYQPADMVEHSFRAIDTPETASYICSLLLADKCASTAALDPALASSTIEDCTLRMF